MCKSISANSSGRLTIHLQANKNPVKIYQYKRNDINVKLSILVSLKTT